MWLKWNFKNTRCLKIGPYRLRQFFQPFHYHSSYESPFRLNKLLVFCIFDDKRQKRERLHAHLQRYPSMKQNDNFIFFSFHFFSKLDDAIVPSDVHAWPESLHISALFR